ncbi:MAG TPA: hypothetical protein VNT79_00340, partial [Phycisphaerae bacterium]|nr:hypothetical protein [Phycisphaerae bacterium]
MFERRLKIVLLVPIFYSLVLIARLYSLQIAQGDEFEQKADDALVSPKKFLPPLRGRILDRFGRPLVSDEPASDIAVHYGVLSMNESYIQRVAERLRRTESRWKKGSLADAEFEVRMRIARMWRTFSRLSGSPMERIRARRDSICKSVETLRRHIWDARRRQGFDEPIAKLHLREEEQLHSILRDVSPEMRAQVEVEMTGLPFMRIEPSVRRVWSENAEPLCHALGTLGQVSARRLQDDARADDQLGAYRPGDEAGVSGIERLCEERLRGTRGFEEKYLDGRVKSSQRPIDGTDVQLTIDLMLQARIQRILAESIAADPSVTGASCVVIDVPTREILAMASAPTFSQERVRREYETLRDDARYRPLLFRA